MATPSAAAAASMLSQTVALVTGGSSGLGAAAARHLLRQGARVVVADVNRSAFDATYLTGGVANATAETVLDLRVLDGGAINASVPLAHGPAVAFCETDVTDETQVSAALDAAEAYYGEPVSAAVSCAGIAVAAKTYSAKKGPHSLSDFERVLRVNALGTFNVSRLAAERISRRDPDQDGLRGCLVHTASIAAFEGQVGQVAYAASKGAVVGMTLPMARELAHLGIRVMTIAPGLFATPLLDKLPPAVRDELGQIVPCPNRLGHPDEFGALVGSILTVPTLNGSVIRLDGALRMPP